MKAFAYTILLIFFCMLSCYAVSAGKPHPGIDMETGWETLSGPQTIETRQETHSKDSVNLARAEADEEETLAEEHSPAEQTLNRRPLHETKAEPEEKKPFRMSTVQLFGMVTGVLLLLIFLKYISSQ